MINNRHIFLLITFAIAFWSCSSGRPSLQSNHIPPSLPDKNYNLPDQGQMTRYQGKRQKIIQEAINNIGRPYRWGGESPFTGFDCSGLVIFTHKTAGISVPRTARNQYFNGRPILKNALKPADLVFFNNPRESKSYHVGIYIGNNRFIHAPGRGQTVKFAKLDNPYFQQHFIGAKSYIP